MHVNAQRVAARKAGREAAGELLPLLDLPDGYGADYADALCKELRGRLPKRRETPKPERPAPSFAQLAAIEMPFGEHLGKQLDDVPSDYLDWLCRTQERFLADLRAYLRHPERVGD